MCHEPYRSFLKSSDYVDVIKRNLGRTTVLLPAEELAPIEARRAREAEEACPCNQRQRLVDEHQRVVLAQLEAVVAASRRA
jgi:hypothetical protein